MPETLKEWKVVITSVGQGYESTEGQHDYKTSTGITYRGWEQLMSIGKFNKNFKDGKSKYFNCNKYGYIAKKCQAKKKEQETRTCFKYNKEGHIAKDYKEKRIIKKQKVQKGSDNKDDKSKQGFGKDLK